MKILAILIPYLEPQQIRDVLQLVSQVEHGQGTLRNAANQALTALAPHLPLEDIEKVIDRNLSLTDNNNVDVRGIANHTISILCPYLPPGKIPEVFDSTINLINKLHSQYTTGSVEIFRLAALLPRLQKQQIDEVILNPLTLLNDKAVVHSEYLIRRLKYQLLSLLLFHMNSNQVKEIVIQGLLWFKGGDRAICEIETEELKKRLSDLEDEQIQEMFEIIVKESTEDKNQTILYLEPYILSVFLPNLRVNQIEILFKCIIESIIADHHPARTKARYGL